MRIAGNKVRKRANGTWELRITVDGRSKSFYGKTQQVVMQKYKDWKADNKRPEKPSKSITLQEWITQWLEIYKKPEIKPSTFKRIDGICTKHIIPHLGKMQLNRIKNIDCQMFLNSLNHLGNTKNKTHIYLKEMLNMAVANNLIKSNPAENTKVTRSESVSGVPLTRNEQETLLNHKFDDPKLHYVFLFILYTGCRRSEALTFNHSRDVKDGFIHIKGTKTKQSNRSVPYFKHIQELLQDVPEIDFSDIKPDRLTKKIKEVFPHHTVKDLRTTFATNCHEKGIAPKVVQKWMGHTTIGTTMNIYTKVQIDFELEESEKLSD